MTSAGRRRADREAERHRFLVEATSLLDASLDPNETMQNIASRAVPDLGELGIVDLLEHDGSITKVAVAAADPEARRDLELMRQRFPVNPGGSHPVARVIRSGTPEILPELTDEIMREIAESPEHLELMRSLKYRAALVVPLRARGRTLGAMSVLHTGDSEETYVTQDLTILGELGLRAAMALDNARLHDEARRAEQRQRFLAESTEILGGSLDHPETLRRIARLIVPQLADMCVVDMLDASGDWERVAVAHVDPRKEQLGWELAQRYAPQPQEREGIMKVIRTGEPALYEEVGEDALRAVAEDERHLEILLDLSFNSVMIVPLKIRGRAIGALTFVAAESGHVYGPDDLELASELARRAAGAVDNARLYTERSHIARTLQESLLPPQLPEVPMLELAGRYRAAGEGNEVGGDFYDVFPLGESSWAVAVGDVCGKGPEAAAVTAVARYSLRAFAVQPGDEWAAVDHSDPVRRLIQLNEALLQQRSDGRFCTVTYAHVELAGERPRIRVASAGHPPPLLLRAGGGVEPLEATGPALGLFAQLELSSETAELAPGDAVVFYTDGVTDAGAPERVLTQEELVRLVGDCVGRPADEIAQRIDDETVAVHGEQPRDDVAILVMRSTGKTRTLPAEATRREGDGVADADRQSRDPAIRLRIPPNPESVSRARGALAALGADVDRDTLQDLSLMVSELVTNSIRHGESLDGGPMWLEIATHPGHVRVEMTDRGPGFEAGRPRPDPGGTGGWGLYLVDRLADRWGVIRAGDATCVWLEVDRPRTAVPESS